jgi:hypothetical protein
MHYKIEKNVSGLLKSANILYRQADIIRKLAVSRYAKGVGFHFFTSGFALHAFSFR